MLESGDFDEYLTLKLLAPAIAAESVHSPLSTSDGFSHPIRECRREARPPYSALE
jgi:hypothetical protein